MVSEHPDGTSTQADGQGSEERPQQRRVRRGAGPRAQARQQQRRRERARTVRRVLLAVVAVAAVGVAVPLAGPTVADTVGGWVDALADGGDGPADGPAEAPGDATGDDAVADDGRRTVLVATTDDAGGGTTAVQLLTHDPASGRGAVVFVPTTMVVDVPGYGLLPLGDAGEFGGGPLLELALENQLGIDVTTAVSLGEQAWAALFSRLGGWEVEVRQALSETDDDGGTTRRFEPGTQFLDGPRLAELLTFSLPGEEELASFTRTQEVLQGMLAAAARDGALDAVFEDGAPMLTGGDTDVVEQVLRGLADGADSDAVVLRTLPVNLVGSGDEVYYRLDEVRADELVEDTLGGTVSLADSGEGVRLEVLNGNGRVGVGADVAALVVPLGHSVVVTRNADDFDHATTRVLVHGDDPSLAPAAQGIVEALGVGRVEVSSVPSTIVDITILVGADFTG